MWKIILAICYVLFWYIAAAISAKDSDEKKILLITKRQWEALFRLYAFLVIAFL